jgi:hypothetical protein
MEFELPNTLVHYLNFYRFEKIQIQIELNSKLTRIQKTKMEKVLNKKRSKAA